MARKLKSDLQNQVLNLENTLESERKKHQADVVKLMGALESNKKIALGHTELVLGSYLRELKILNDILLTQATFLEKNKKEYFEKRSRLCEDYLNKVRILLLPEDEKEIRFGAFMIADQTQFKTASSGSAPAPGINNQNAGTVPVGTI